MRTIVMLAAACAGAWAQGGELLVLLKGVSALGFYTSEGKEITRAAVREHPHEMVFSRDGRFLYTTDNGTMRIEHPGKGGHHVSILDVKARRKAGEIDLGEFYRPHGIDLDPRNGRLLVTTELPDQLLVVDPESRQVLRTYDTKGKTSHMVTLAPKYNTAFVSNSTSASVSAVDLGTGAVKVIPCGERPEGGVLSADGRRVFVCNREAAQIMVIDAETKSPAGVFKTGKGPVRIDRTPDGKLLVYACMHDETVEFADPATGKVVGKVQLKGPIVSLHLSPDGRYAYASAEEIDTVYVVSVGERKLLRTLKMPKGSGPDPVRPVMRYDPSGN
jgi:DNA-binding beta-propeller fold protein YncE